VAGAVLLASFGFFAPAYAEPLVTGPLGINGSLAVLGLAAIDDSLMVPGDIHARGSITAICKRMADHGWLPSCAVGRVDAQGPMTGRR
jgi:hypothetical protein